MKCFYATISLWVWRRHRRVGDGTARPDCVRTVAKARWPAASC